MITKKMMLEIARERARLGAAPLRDQTGLYCMRIGSKTDLLGALIPQSLYYSMPNIEMATTYDLCNGEIFEKQDLEVIRQIDHIQAFHDPSKWVKKIDKLLRSCKK